MAPPRALLVVAILLTGCQGATPPGPTDPFFGRTRIEPPHTGAASSGSSIAPYSPTPPQVTVPPAMTPVSGASSIVPSSSTLALAPVSEPIAVPAAARQMESPNQQIVSCVATSGDVRSDNSATSVSAPSLTPPKTVAPIATSATSSQQAITTRERVYQTISRVRKRTWLRWPIQRRRAWWVLQGPRPRQQAARLISWTCLRLQTALCGKSRQLSRLRTQLIETFVHHLRT